MKTNGITYDETGLPMPNTNWEQTAVYLLSSMQITQQELANYLMNSGNTTPTLTIVKTKELPQVVHLELYDPFPIKKVPIVYTKTIVHQKPPIVIRKPTSELYKKCPNFPEDDMVNERCRARLHFCYTYIKEQNNVVTTGDLSVFKLKQNDCGIAYTKAINNGKQHYTIKVKQELNKYFNKI